MRATQAWLWLNAVVFLLLGAHGLLDPVEHMRVFDVVLLGPSILAEMRAMYGGAHLALGLLFAWGAMRAAWTRPALVTLTLFVGGLAFGRALALAGPMPNRAVLAFLAIEAFATAVGLVLLMRKPAPAGSLP